MSVVQFKKNNKLRADTAETSQELVQCLLYPSNPMSDQDRISPYNIKTIPCRKVMRIKTNINKGIIG